MDEQQRQAQRGMQVEISNKREELSLKKREIETKLCKIKQLIRTSGRMPNEKYKQCSDSQAKYVSNILVIDQEICLLNRKLRLLAVEEIQQRPALVQAPVLVTQDDSTLVQALCQLRTSYQEFAADLTRVSSMRQMAAEFVLKLNEVIRAALKEPLKSRA